VYYDEDGPQEVILRSEKKPLYEYGPTDDEINALVQETRESPAVVIGIHQGVSCMVAATEPNRRFEFRSSRLKKKKYKNIDDLENRMPGEGKTVNEAIDYAKSIQENYKGINFIS